MDSLFSIGDFWCYVMQLQISKGTVPHMA